VEIIAFVYNPHVYFFSLFQPPPLSLGSAGNMVLCVVQPDGLGCLVVMDKE
jgi:hypothetical protein